MVSSWSSRVPIDWRLSPLRLLSWVTLLATRVPVMDWTLFRAMSPAAPVAMAMEPEKVEQEAMALASPELWIVVVAEALQAAIGAR